MAVWATVEGFAEFLRRDLADDMADPFAASLAWCQRKRRDLPADVVPSADVVRAVYIYAGLLWREKDNPSGFPTYSDLDDGGADPVGDAMANVYRLLGRKPRIG